METLAIQLAMNGAAVVTVSLFAGLFLYRSILRSGNEHEWHLLHAGSSGRGVLLLALAATIHLPALPDWLLSTVAWLIIFFVWTSTVAMIIRAATGQRGFSWSGPPSNRLAYGLYLLGTIAVFPAFFILVYGLVVAV